MSKPKISYGIRMIIAQWFLMWAFRIAPWEDHGLALKSTIEQYLSWSVKAGIPEKYRVKDNE